MPAAVGYFEASSAIESPTRRTRRLISGQPIEIRNRRRRRSTLSEGREAAAEERR